MRAIEDLRAAVRALLSAPKFAALAVLTLALGVGANSALFTIAAAYLRPELPFTDPGRIVVVETERIGQPGMVSGVSFPDLQDLQRGNRVFERLSAFNWPVRVVVKIDDATHRARAAAVTPDLFEMLGAAAAVGRTLSEADAYAAAEPVAVISDAAWTRLFARDPKVLSRSLRVNDRARAIVGVMPAAFTFPASVDLWIPLQPAGSVTTDRGARHGLFALGRLRPGVSVTRAQQDMSTIAANLEQAYPDTNRGQGVRLRTFWRWSVGEWIRPVGVLLALGALVLLTACANIATVLIARGVTRSREIAIRTAIGASRLQLVRQFAAEYLVLAAVAGMAGVLLAAWTSRVMNAWMPPTSMPQNGVKFAMDATVFAATGAVALLSVLLFGIAPLLQAARIDVIDVLRRGGGGTMHPAGRRWRAALVVAQFALALVLASSGGLLWKNLRQFDAIDLGFDRTNLATMWLDLPPERYGTAAAAGQFEERAAASLERVPGIATIAATTRLDVHRADDGDWGFTTGREMPERTISVDPVAAQAVSPSFLRTMGITLRQGRDFDATDRAGAPRVAIVSEKLATRFFPAGQAIGGRIRFGPRGSGDWMTIVGVTADVREPSWYELTIAPYWIYLPRAQHEAPGLSFVMRTSLPPAQTFDGVRAAIRSVDPALTIDLLRPMEEAIYAEGFDRRAVSVLAVTFATLGLALAVIGLAGVVSWSVGSRRREIAIRMALGSQPGSVVRAILREGVVLGVVGAAIGVPVSLLLGDRLRNLLDDVSTRDPQVLSAVVAILIACAAIASYVPARRAAHVDPASALKVE